MSCHYSGHNVRSRPRVLLLIIVDYTAVQLFFQFSALLNRYPAGKSIIQLRILLPLVHCISTTSSQRAYSTRTLFV